MAGTTPDRSSTLGDIDHILSGALAAVAGLLIGLMWTPWLRSGASTRNSFELFRALQVLGLDELTPFRVLWFVLPVILAGASVAAVANRPVAAAVLVLVAAVVVGVVANAVQNNTTPGWGADVSQLGAFVAIAVSCTVVLRRALVRLTQSPVGREAGQGGGSVGR